MLCSEKALTSLTVGSSPLVSTQTEIPFQLFMQAPPFSQEELVQGLTSEGEQKNIVVKNFDYELNFCLNSE